MGKIKHQRLTIARLQKLSWTLILLTGCQVGPHYVPVECEFPSQWCEDPIELDETLSADCFLWWQAFNDPILDGLIERAACQNLDLAIASNRILQARLQRKGKVFECLPRLDASFAAGHLYNKESILEGLLDHAIKEGTQGSNRLNTDFFELGVDAQWEIDLFGKIAHEIKALDANVKASQENLRHLTVVLSAEVARNYIELRSTQHRLVLLEEHIAAQKDTVHLTDELLKIGKIGLADAKQAEEQLYQLQAERPTLELTIARAMHRLAVLVDQAPCELQQELACLQPMPCLPCTRPLGLPSELLRRRPDVTKAELELAAAVEQVGSAVASLFPKLTLRGFIGDIGLCLKSLVHPSNHTWFADAELLQPLFNSRLLQKNVDFSRLEAQQAFYTYQKAVLEALEETENAIASFHSELEKRRALEQARLASQEAYDLSHELYQKGFKDYFEVLSINRSLIRTKEAALQSQATLLLQYIALYKALGGGWEVPDEC